MTFDDFSEQLLFRAALAETTVTAEVLERLWVFYELLRTWNRKINLTSFDLDALSPEGFDRLFIEPVSAVRYAPPTPRVIDIGSGGGSPAIPFAVAAGASALTMVESRTRKSVFLLEAARAVAVPATVITSRSDEVVTRPEFQDAFDIVTVRAVKLEVRDLDALAKLLKPDGRLFLFHRRTVEVALRTAASAVHPLTHDADLLVRPKIVSRGTSGSGSRES